jgi:hypothetical protein
VALRLEETESPRPPRAVVRRPGPWVNAAIGLAVYLALAVLLFSSAWVSPQTTAIGLGTDPVFSIWFLRWVPFAIGHGWNPLLTTYLDYPAGANLSWSGLFPLPALVLSPVTLWLGPVVAYNLLATLALALSAWAGFFAARRFVSSPFAAALAGLLYGFSPALIAQSLGHPQIAVAFIPPLMLLALDEILVRQRWTSLRSGALLGLLGAAQLLTGEELLAAEVVVGAAGTALLMAAKRKAIASHLGYALRAAGVAAVVFLVLVVGPLASQFFGPQRVVGSLQPANVYVSDLFNFIVPTSVQQFAPGFALRLSDQFSGSLAEWNAYLGVPLLVLLVVAAIRYRAHLMLRLCALLALLFALLSLGITLHVGGHITPIPVVLLAVGFVGLRGWIPLRAILYTFIGLWAGLAIVPVVSNILPGRLMLFVFLFAGILLAGFVDHALRWPNGRHRALALAAVGLALLPLVPRTPYPAAAMPTPAFFTALGSLVPDGSVMLVAPYVRGGNTEGMLWQAQSGMAFKMPEGYALIPGPRANPPNSVLGSEMVAIEHGTAPDLNPDSLDRMRADLKAWAVTTVVVGPMPHRVAVVALFTALLGGAPVERGGVQLWTGVTASSPQQ